MHRLIAVHSGFELPVSASWSASRWVRMVSGPVSVSVSGGMGGSASSTGAAVRWMWTRSVRSMDQWLRKPTWRSSSSDLRSR